MKRLLLTLTGVLAMMTVLPAQDLTVCYGKGYTLNSTADAVSADGSAVTYTWYENDVLLDDENDASLTIAAGERAAGEYAYVRKASNATCSEVSSNTFIVQVDAAPVAPTGLAPSIAMFCSSEFTAATLTASGASAGSYEWGTGNTVGDNSLGTTVGNTYAVSPSAPTTYWVRMKGAGACSAMVTEGMTTAIWVYTEPEPVGYFADFNDNASTYVTLTDERDGKVYPVVKLGGRWIMARNLNYQKDLTWYAESKSPSTVSGSNAQLRGVFWCPGGDGGNSATTSTLASCDVWGALYAWETAMSFDGKGGWTEITGKYNSNGAANAANSQFNHGRSADGSGNSGRGICPPSWHVPTDFEWGKILDAMEGNGTGDIHQTATTGWKGTDAGTHGKSKCTCADGGCNDDANVSWYFYDSNQGDDLYGFRVLPSGLRNNDGSNFRSRGSYAFFWSSSTNSSTGAWARYFYYGLATVNRWGDDRSFGFSVRCIRNSD